MALRAEYTILELIEAAARNIKAQPLNLGGISGVGGGVGGPPGGFIGQLPQARVSYDETEAATLFTPASGMSLVDNLNHIRYRLDAIGSGGGGGGGIDETAADLLYLRLDTTNNPLTDELDIVPAGAGDTGLYVQTLGDAYSLDIEQTADNGDTVNSPALFLARYPNSGTVTYASPILEFYDGAEGVPSEDGAFITYYLAGSTLIALNARPLTDGIAYAWDTNTDVSSLGRVLSIKNAGVDAFWVNGSGIAFDAEGKLQAERVWVYPQDSDETLHFGTSPTGGYIGADLFAADTLYIVGAGTVPDRAVYIYDNLQVDNQIQSAFMNLTNPGATYNIDGNPHSHDGLVTAVVNTNNIFSCDNAGTSAFVGTINGTPSGTSVTYNVSSGNENAMVPTLTTQLAKMRLYNTTRGNNALISNCNTGTNVITLTATVPANWANGDTITIASQTVSGVFNWVDLEITSGEFLGKSKVYLYLAATDTGGAGQFFLVHPFETFSASKLVGTIITQSTQTMVGEYLYKLTSNIITVAWTASGASSMSVIAREAGHAG